jgi:hypothetical protein
MADEGDGDASAGDDDDEDEDSDMIGGSAGGKEMVRFDLMGSTRTE